MRPTTHDGNDKRQTGGWRQVMTTMTEEGAAAGGLSTTIGQRGDDTASTSTSKMMMGHRVGGTTRQWRGLTYGNGMMRVTT